MICSNKWTCDIFFSPEPSPMVLDTSLTENQLHSQTDRETDRKDSIYEVSEYAEEIFQYLREAEVTDLILYRKKLSMICYL